MNWGQCPQFCSFYPLNKGMRVHDLLNNSISDLTKLIKQCSQFIEEADNQYLMKSLPRQYNDVHKVKVRKRKTQSFDNMFNEAFNHHYKLRQRSIFANGQQSFVVEGNTSDAFYIFPIDGYKFMYCNEVQNSTIEYQQVFSSIVDGFGPDKGNQVISEMLKFTYIHDKLNEGISTGSEIIFYNIPYYYAVRANMEYDSLLTSLEQL